MKIRTVLATAVGVGIGYVLGTRAGRGKFEELKAQAQRIATDPDVRQKVADLPHQVRENLPKAQSVVSDAVKVATDKVHSVTDQLHAATDQAHAKLDEAQATSSDSKASDDAAASVVTEPVVVEETVVEPTLGEDTAKS